MLECTTPEVKLREIVNLAEGLDYNEWLASHSTLFLLIFGFICLFVNQRTANGFKKSKFNETNV